MKKISVEVKNNKNQQALLTFVETKSGCNNAYGIDKGIHMDYTNLETGETIKNYKSFDVRYTYNQWHCDLEYFAYWFVVTQWYGFDVKRGE